MKFLRASLAVLALSVPLMANAKMSLYDEMLEMTKTNLDTSNLRILHAVAEWLPHIENPEDATDDQLKGLLLNDTALCTKEKLNLFSECPDVQTAAISLATRLQSLETLGRDLQVIASSFEEPLLGGFALSFPSRMQGITAMWKPDGSAATTTGAGNIRRETVSDRGGIGGAVSRVQEALNGLDTTDLTAAVSRYRFAGVRWLRGERPELGRPSPDIVADADGTQRELRQKLWPDIEDKLL